MKNKSYIPKLVQEQGGYQLYTLKRCIGESEQELPIIARNLGQNDKVKIVGVLSNGKIGYEIDPFEEDALQKCINYIMAPLEHSGIVIYGGEGFSSLEKCVQNMKTERNRLGPLSSDIDEDYKKIRNITVAWGHDVNYANIYGSNWLAAGGNYELYMPVFGIPERLLKTRDEVIFEYGVKKDISVAVRHVVDREPFYTNLRAGGEISSDIVNAVVAVLGREPKTCFSPYYTEDNVRRTIKANLDYLPQEIKRHESTLDIINYLKSRIEK